MTSWSEGTRAGARVAHDAALALAVAVPLGLTLGWAGTPLGTATMLGLWALAAVAVVLLRRGFDAPRPTPEPAKPAPSRWFVLLATVALALALGVFLYKLATWPLWSWDHYQIWGVKARRLLLDDRLDLAYLHTDAMLYARPDYPLGVPFASRLLTLGAVPGELVFKMMHALAGLGLVALLVNALLRAGLAVPWALGLGAWAASSPLFWDSEAYGLAEMPLAFVLVAAALAGLAWRESPSRSLAWRAGLLLGLLPWIKHEGRLLAVFLLLALLVAAPRGRRWSAWAPVALVAAVPIALERAMSHWGLAPGVSFLSGDPLTKLGERLPQTLDLLASMARRLGQGDFLGFWPLFPIALVLAWRRRKLDALLTGGVVLAQLAIYSALTFLVYLPAEQHLDAAYDRIVAALVPLGMLACGLALVGSRHADPPDRLRERR